MHVLRPFFCTLVLITIAAAETSTSQKQLLNAGRNLKKEKNYERAIDAFTSFLKSAPNHPKALADLAHTYFLVGKLEDALWTYKKLLTLSIDSPKLYTKMLYNTACTLKTMGLMREAVGVYEKVVAAQPDHHMAQIGLAKSYLATGDLERGWKKFEWRYADPSNYRQPKYDVATFAGKKIVVLAEWGLGDSIQFVRYVRLLKEAGATVIVETFAPLIQLFSLCPYINTVCTTKAQHKPECDLRIPMLSLPMIFDTTVHTIPNKLPYLYADQQLVKHWGKKMPKDTISVGLCWQAKPGIFLEQQPRTKRSVPLKQLAPFAKIEGIRFYSLQQQHGTEQLNNLPEEFVVHEFDPNFDNTNGRFMDTAAVIKNLDLIISVDTSIVHLAGALGANVWVLIPHSAEWRWMINRDDTPWYPGMRLFRQPKPGDWNSVIKIVHENLENFVKNKRYVEHA